MNEPFARKIYDAGAGSLESGIQDGMNFYGQQFRNLIKTFPAADAPIFLAAMKGVHDSVRGIMPANGPELEDYILQHTTTIVIPIPGGKK